ncbi:MAG: hypothetical protein HY098_05370 [Nitrospinae bacterium]|nr:hypothetical protein [Nitrospinota bacterium]
MFNSSSGAPKKGGKKLFFTVCSAVFLLSLAIYGVSKAATPESEPRKVLPKIYQVAIDKTNKAKVGKDVLEQLGSFFDYADNAVKTKDIRALGSLYSERYRDGDHTKGDVLKVWQRIFDKFDDLRLTHNLRFISEIPDKNTIILSCSGVLVGSKIGEKNNQALDHWKNMSHVLAKEDGAWKIVGSYGVGEPRYWFDKPMHPLF